MKWWMTLIGAMFLLTACTYEGSGETKQKEKGDSASSVTIKPAELSQREKSIITQMGGGYHTFYTVEGELNEGEGLISSIVTFKEGKQKRELVSASEPGQQKSYHHELHSFGLQMEKDTVNLMVGSPNGNAKGSTTVPEQIDRFHFEHLDENMTVTKGEPIYLSYLVGTSQHTFSVEANEDLTTLPKSVANAEYAVVFKVEWKDGTGL
ncbi:hypothetical protein SAMN05192559_107147 [Halobacillus karajensis]|uniref:hypothetical protein n=1 Tax=Halobacillus karajensis TaxID=195088 RepID=UPI0008A80602|nr:hypothetical protein [Halobacillus karajensis]SEI01812.1 hypothetical protein SAMN05192559_107147 [Halobacillus karajensis]